MIGDGLLVAGSFSRQHVSLTFKEKDSIDYNRLYSPVKSRDIAIKGVIWGTFFVMNNAVSSGPNSKYRLCKLTYLVLALGAAL